MIRFSLFFCLVFCVYFSPAQTKTYWSPRQNMLLKNISTVRVSPDGKKVVYAVREAVMTSDRSEYVNQLFLTNIATPDTSVKLSRGDRDNSIPRWSNDGKYIGFVSNRDGRNNLYILPVEGGESERLTNVKTGVSDFKWSPDNKSIAYTMSDSATTVEERKKTAKDDWYFMDEEVKQGRIYVIQLSDKDSTGKLRILQVSKANRHITTFNWSADGKWIVYAHASTPKVDDTENSDISMVNVQSGEVKDVAVQGAGESNPVFSPDGASIAYMSRDEQGTWGGPSYIKVIKVNGGNPVTLAATPSEQPILIGWSSDGKSIYVSEPSRTNTRIFKLSVDGKKAEPFSGGEGEVITQLDINATGTHLAMVIQNTKAPQNAYVTSTAAMKPVRVSNVNKHVAAYPVPLTEVVKWKSFDGKEIEGLLTYPVNYEKGKKYPIILNIHGGPAGVFVQSFIAGNNDIYPIAALSENGIFVLRPNPRGSSGYGTEFRLANQRDWGGNDYKDLMLGVDYMISTGMVDSAKMGVMGWSYGGFMTSWVVGHTNRFKAASIGAPVVDLVFQNMTDDISSFLPSYMKKQPWEDWDVYNEHSPLRYVQNVNTPVLLQHGENDIRVPFSQGVMFYHSLKRRGVPVRFLVLPRQPHGPVEPKMALKISETNLQWMLHYLMGKPLNF